MVRDYYGQRLDIKVGKKPTRLGGGEIYKTLYENQNILVVGLPQVSGKSSFAKDFTVQAATQGRPLCVFDHVGEWARSVTRRNPRADKPMILKDVGVYRDYTFKISSITVAGDLIGLGFTENSAQMLCAIIAGLKDWHEDNPDKFLQALEAVPTTNDDLAEFNARFDEQGIRLSMPLHTEVKRNMLNRWNQISGWFWHPDDTRPIFDFKEEWLRHQCIIIDLSLEEINEFGERVRTGIPEKSAFAVGQILRQIAPIHRIKHGIIVEEEMWNLCPPVKDTFAMPSSLSETIKLVTAYPKDNIVFIGICQDESQIDERVTKMMTTRVLFQCNGEGYAYTLAKRNRFYRKTGYREMLWFENSHNYDYVIPNEACCWVKH